MGPSTLLVVGDAKMKLIARSVLGFFKFNSFFFLFLDSFAQILYYANSDAQDLLDSLLIFPTFTTLEQ
jgi:hypothetical protein